MEKKWFNDQLNIYVNSSADECFPTCDMGVKPHAISVTQIKILELPRVNKLNIGYYEEC